jgi:hypothetical protein
MLQPLTVEGREREGMGTYKWKLLPLGPRHICVSGWASRTISIVDRATLKKVRSLRSWAPDLVIDASDGGSVWVCSFYGGEARLLDTERLSVRSTRTLRLGRDPFHDGDKILVAAGRRVAANEHVAVEQIHAVEPTHVAVLDAGSFEAFGESKPIRHLRGVLGLDRHGHIVVSTHGGLALLDRTTLALVDDIEVTDRAWQVCFNVETNSVVLMPKQFWGEELVVVSW